MKRRNLTLASKLAVGMIIAILAIVAAAVRTHDARSATREPLQTYIRIEPTVTLGGNASISGVFVNNTKANIRHISIEFYYWTSTRAKYYNFKNIASSKKSSLQFVDKYGIELQAGTIKPGKNPFTAVIEGPKKGIAYATTYCVRALVSHDDGIKEHMWIDFSGPTCSDIVAKK